MIICSVTPVKSVGRDAGAAVLLCMRLEWKGAENDAPFSTNQTIDLRNVIPEGALLIGALMVKKLSDGDGTGSATVQLCWREEPGFYMRVMEVRLDFTDPSQVIETRLNAMSKIALDLESEFSELFINMFVEEGATGTWTLDVTII